MWRCMNLLYSLDFTFLFSRRVRRSLASGVRYFFSCSFILSTRSVTVFRLLPVKGGEPVSMSCTKIPKLHQSTSLPCLLNTDIKLQVIQSSQFKMGILFLVKISPLNEIIISLSVKISPLILTKVVILETLVLSKRTIVPLRSKHLSFQ